MAHRHQLNHKVGLSATEGVWRNAVRGLLCIGGPLDGERIMPDRSVVIRVRHETGIGIYTLKNRVWQWSM